MNKLIYFLQNKQKPELHTMIQSRHNTIKAEIELSNLWYKWPKYTSTRLNQWNANQM